MAVWVAWDANRRKNNWFGWGGGTLFLGFLVLPFYFAKRHLKDGEVREGGTAWNVLRGFALVWTGYMIALAVAALGVISESASETMTAAEQTGTALGSMMGLGMIGALWFFPMFGALVLGFFVKKSSVVEEGPTGPLSPGVSDSLSDNA